MTENELHVIFSSNIKLHRNNLRMSQAALAKKTGVSTNFINDLEAGKKWASLATIAKLAEVFGIDAYELLRPPGLFPDNMHSIVRKYTENIHAALEETHHAFMKEKETEDK
jgi:transcriptional regulator with XRE-family HTH domain